MPRRRSNFSAEESADFAQPSPALPPSFGAAPPDAAPPVPALLVPPPLIPPAPPAEEMPPAPPRAAAPPVLGVPPSAVTPPPPEEVPPRAEIPPDAPPVADPPLPSWGAPPEEVWPPSGGLLELWMRSPGFDSQAAKSRLNARAVPAPRLTADSGGPDIFERAGRILRPDESVVQVLGKQPGTLRHSRPCARFSRCVFNFPRSAGTGLERATLAQRAPVPRTWYDSFAPVLLPSPRFHAPMRLNLALARALLARRGCLIASVCYSTTARFSSNSNG